MIVSTGSINSPKILMLSGNVPKENLKKYDIKIIGDLSVKRYFQDHTTSALVVPINFTSTRYLLL